MNIQTDFKLTVFCMHVQLTVGGKNHEHGNYSYGDDI